MDLKRVILILMALACIIDTIGIVHCHIYYSRNPNLHGYASSYTIIFPILLCLSSFLLIEQLFITDGTIIPLSRIRTVYALLAAITLFFFGVAAAIVSSRWYVSSISNLYYDSAVISAVIAFAGMIVYVAEALARNRKCRMISLMDH